MIDWPHPDIDSFTNQWLESAMQEPSWYGRQDQLNKWFYFYCNGSSNPITVVEKFQSWRIIHPGSTRFVGESLRGTKQLDCLYLTDQTPGEWSSLELSEYLFSIRKPLKLSFYEDRRIHRVIQKTVGRSWHDWDIDNWIEQHLDCCYRCCLRSGKTYCLYDHADSSIPVKTVVQQEHEDCFCFLARVFSEAKHSIDTQ